MSKRFTDTGKWDDPWHRRLTPLQKTFWDFICAKCDNAGVWEVDFEAASFKLNAEVNIEILSAINKEKVRVKLFDSNKLLLILGHVEFQCGNLLQKNLTNLQKSAITLLYKHIENKGLTKEDFSFTGKLPVAYGYKYKGKGKGIGKGNSKGSFTKPTIEEIEGYCKERKNTINPKKFFDSNESKGWVVGKNRTPMKDWKATIRTWEGNNYEQTNESRPRVESDSQRDRRTALDSLGETINL